MTTSISTRTRISTLARLWLVYALALALAVGCAETPTVETASATASTATPGATPPSNTETASPSASSPVGASNGAPIPAPTANAPTGGNGTTPPSTAESASVRQQLDAMLRGAGFSAAFSRMAEPIPNGARIAVAPVFVSVTAGGERELAEIAAEHYAERGFSVMPVELTAALWGDLGFIPRQVFDADALAVFGRFVGATGVVGISVSTPNLAGETDFGFGSAVAIEMIAVDAMAESVFPGARLELVFSATALPPPPVAERDATPPAISALHPTTLALSESRVVRLDVAAMARADFVTNPWQLHTNDRVPAGTLIKFWISATPRAHVWAFLVSAEHPPLVLHPLIGTRPEKITAGDALDGDTVGVPAWSWVPLERPGRYLLVVEAVAAEFVVPTTTTTTTTTTAPAATASTAILRPPDTKVFGGPSPALRATIDRLTPGTATPGTANADLAAQWRHAIGHRQADMVAWGNAWLLRGPDSTVERSDSAYRGTLVVRDLAGSVRRLPNGSRLEIDPLGIFAQPRGQVAFRVQQIPAITARTDTFSGDDLQMLDDATNPFRPVMDVTFSGAYGLGGATVVIPFDVTARTAE